MKIPKSFKDIMATLLRVPVAIRNKIYEYLLYGSETINHSMVPRMLSQVDITCFEDILPGAGLFLACKQLRKEAKNYLYSNTHFSARLAAKISAVLQRFRFGRSLCRIESLEMNTCCIMQTRAFDMSNELHIIISGMPARKFLCISTAFLGDDRDDLYLAASGEVLFERCNHIRACLLRFGAFATLRHRSLKLLVWGEPTGDVKFSDLRHGVVHYTVKMMADGRDLQPTDMVMNSTAIRQYTFDELLSMEVEDFRGVGNDLSSEYTIIVGSSSDTLASRRFVHAAFSGIEHIAYLTAEERKRIGLKKPLDYDSLIAEARTGLLDSDFAPYHKAVLAGMALTQRRSKRAFQN